MYSSTLTSTSALDGGGWSAPRPGRFTPGKNPVSIVQETGWTPGPVWTDAENLSYSETRSQDRPVRSESLYRLSYPGPIISLYTTIIYEQAQKQTCLAVSAVLKRVLLFNAQSTVVVMMVVVLFFVDQLGGPIPVQFRSSELSRCYSFRAFSLLVCLGQVHSLPVHRVFKASSPQSAAYCFLFQNPVPCLFPKDVQLLLTSSSSSSRHLSLLSLFQQPVLEGSSYQSSQPFFVLFEVLCFFPPCLF